MLINMEATSTNFRQQYRKQIIVTRCNCSKNTLGQTDENFILQCNPASFLSTYFCIATLSNFSRGRTSCIGREESVDARAILGDFWV